MISILAIIHTTRRMAEESGRLNSSITMDNSEMMSFMEMDYLSIMKIILNMKDHL